MKYLTKEKNIINSLIFISCIFYFSGTVSTQSSDTLNNSDVNEHFSIKWISQFSSSKDLKNSNKLSHRIFNFLFGSGDRALVRPTSMISLANNKWIIVDQGNNNLMYLHSEEGDFYSLSQTVLPSPIAVCASSSNDIYFTDSYLNKIFKGKVDDKQYEVLNDSLMLKRPTGIAFLPQRREIWVVETMAHQITVMNPGGKVLRRYGKRGTSPGEFNFPTFLWIDAQGRIYIVDSMNFRVQIMNPEGEIISFFGEAGDATGYFSRPKGIATDTRGNIYVVDALFHTVQIFNQKGQFLSNFGKQGREPGQFWLPVGIYIDEDDRIYVSDSYNSRIQVFQLIQGVLNEN